MGSRSAPNCPGLEDDSKLQPAMHLQLILLDFIRDSGHLDMLDLTGAAQDGDVDKATTEAEKLSRIGHVINPKAPRTILGMVFWIQYLYV